MHAATAYLAHEGCLVLTVTSGFGGIGCNIAVAIIQAAADYISLDDYKTCKN